MYYQDGRKEEFLREYILQKERAFYRSLFNVTYPYEKRLNRDLCEMNTEEILEILKPYKASTAFAMRSRISKYIEWCRMKGYCKVNPASKHLLQGDKIKAVSEEAKVTSYISPGLYRKYLKRILNSPESNNAAYDLPIFMSLYECVTDVSMMNLAHLRMGDMVGDCLCLYSGETVQVSQELMAALTEARKVEVLFSHSYLSKLNVKRYPDSIWATPQKATDISMTAFFTKRYKEITRLIGDESLQKRTVRRSGFFNYVIARCKQEGIDVARHMKTYTREYFPAHIYEGYFREKGEELTFYDFVNTYGPFVEHIEEITSL